MWQIHVRMPIRYFGYMVYMLNLVNVFVSDKYLLDVDVTFGCVLAYMHKCQVYMLM